MSKHRDVMNKVIEKGDVVVYAQGGSISLVQGEITKVTPKGVMVAPLKAKRPRAVFRYPSEVILVSDCW